MKYQPLYRIQISQHVRGDLRARQINAFADRLYLSVVADQGVAVTVTAEGTFEICQKVFESILALNAPYAFIVYQRKPAHITP